MPTTQIEPVLFHHIWCLIEYVFLNITWAVVKAIEFLHQCHVKKVKYIESFHYFVLHGRPIFWLGNFFFYLFTIM